jgi:predicted dinucleotide-binding enzyme
VIEVEAMHIAIIGSGNVGTALARSAARAGHDVTVASRDTAEALQLAESVGGRAVPSNKQALERADVAFLAVPAAEVVGLAAELGDAAGDKVLVDVTNRPTPTADGAVRPSIAEEVQAQVPKARVVKAINTIFAARQAEPDIGGTPADGMLRATTRTRNRPCSRS